MGPEGHRWADPADAAKCCRGYTRTLVVVRDSAGDPVPSWVWVSEEMRGGDDGPAAFPFPAEEWRPEMTPFWPEPPHTVFVEALAETNPDSEEWLELNAGLKTLRLIDRWARRLVVRRTPTFRELATVRCAIDPLLNSPAKRMMTAIVKAVTQYAPMQVPSVWGLLVAYGDILAREHGWLLAAEVYGTAIGVVRSRSEQMLAPEYHRRMGQCLMHAGRHDAALAAHEVGRALAQRLGAWEHELANRLGLAAVRLAAGDIRGSDRTFADVVRDAELWRLPAVRATALHDRALAAYERTGDEARRAVVWLYEAYGLYDEGVRRDDALDDLASVFIALEFLDVAREIYRHFVVLADDPDRVVTCGLKGLRLAAQRGDAAEFEFYAARLAREEMHPWQLADYFLALGLGHWRRGRLSRARAAYTRAMRLGEQYRLFQSLHDAEQARSRLDAGVAPPPALVATAAEPTAPVARVIAAIRTLCSAPNAAAAIG